MESNVGLWEKWSFYYIKKDLNKEINKNDVNSKEEKSKESRIREYLFKVLTLLNGKNDFMPNFDFEVNPPMTFPYEFKIKNIDDNEFGAIFKNVFMNKEILSDI